MISVITKDCESGIPGTFQPHNHSMRWHIEHTSGRIYIVYADSMEAAADMFASMRLSGYVEPSGYYCQRANAIYQAKDGPTVIHDNSNGRLT